MPKIMLGVDEAMGALGRVKKGQQPGPDKFKVEIYKSQNDRANNAVLEDGTLPEKWKRSRTVMILL